MKKWIALALICAMALSLCACGGKIDEETQKKLDLYDKYEKYIDLLEDGKYDKLIDKLIDKYGYQGGSGEPVDPDDPGNPDHPGDPDDPGETSVPTDPPEPTQEEKYLLQQYYEIVDSLYWYEQGSNLSVDEYDDAGNYITYYSGQAALCFSLQKLKELTVADQWTDWLKQNYNYDREYNWNRLELLGKFSVVEDVILKQLRSSIDHMGNVTDPWTNCSWTYNLDGSVAMISDPSNIIEQIESNPFNISNSVWYTYDASGLVTEARYGYTDTTYYRVIPSYDAAGNKISEHVVSNNGETDITYTYNDAGQLVKIYWKPITSSGTTTTNYAINYTYDANGRVLKQEKVEYYDYDDYYGCEVVDEKWIYEYTYDANGQLASGTYTYEDWSCSVDSHYDDDLGQWIYETTQYIYRNKLDKYTYTCDEQGRVLMQQIAYGNEYYQYGDKAGQLYDKSDYATGEIQFVYGDYVFYKLAQ